MSISNVVFITNPWSSSYIRGYQIAERLGARCNPKEKVPMDSTFVFVKAVPDKELKNMYIDVVDAYKVLDVIGDYPNTKLIAISDIAAKYMRNRCNNEITVIPEHHCNFENILRCRTEVTTVGFIGYAANLVIDVNRMKQLLADIGLDFIWRFEDSFDSRDDVCNFYKSIDIQLTFRPKFPKPDCPPELKNALKLSNAGSFKIPTVACSESSYLEEYPNCFLVADTVNEVIERCKILKNDRYIYVTLTNKCHKLAQDKHIDKIIPLYKELLDG